MSRKLAAKESRLRFGVTSSISNPTSFQKKEFHSGLSNNLVSNTRGHEILLRDFAEKYLSGGKVMVSGEDARDATELILRIYESAKKD